MRKIAVLLAAGAIVGAAAVPSTASDDIPPPVTIETNGVCPTNYRAVVQAGNTVVCVTNVRAPRVRPTTNGCVAGETPYLVDNRYGVCTS
ncbi:MAG TPA: hypothetical protein VNA20_17435 [Frankiaceae bacterium]|nr:hypothetical protein [Frankiaceae bacterium]